MPFNMEWFRAQAEKKKQEELAKKNSENLANNKPVEIQKANVNEKNGYYKFHENEDKKNKHYFLSEEVLVPHANNTDTQRLNIFGLYKYY